MSVENKHRSNGWLQRRLFVIAALLLLIGLVMPTAMVSAQPAPESDAALSPMYPSSPPA